MLQDFYVKNIGKYDAYDLLAMQLNLYCLTLKKIKDLAALGSYHVTIISKGK